MFMLIRHKVRDFSEWKRNYDSGLSKRTREGLTEKYLLRSDVDPNEVIILFETDDFERARRFSQSTELRQLMEKAGVVEEPDIYFLNDASLSARAIPSLAMRDEIEEFEKPEGVTRSGGEIETEFVYLAPHAGQVNLSGNFNNWDPKSLPMKKNRRGQWKAIVRLRPGRYEYRFIVDGTWVIDKHCADVAVDESGASKCVINVTPKVAA